MIWERLKKMQCPKCPKVRQLMPNAGAHGYECVCGYFIGTAKFDELVSKMYKPHTFEHERDRDSELNNLGHKEVTEDFSDYEGGDN